MSKNEIQLPNKFHFTTELLIRKTDLSLDIHVSFASILDMVMEAHLQFLLKNKFSPTNIFGKGIIFAEANIKYQGELFYEDILRIEVGLMNFFEKGFDYVFRLTKGNGTKPVAYVIIRVLFFDYELRKISLVPEEFKKLYFESSKETKTAAQTDSNLWTKAHQISIEAYKLTKKFPSEELNHLTARIRRTATSFPLSIKEFESKLNKDLRLKSYSRVRGYIEELRYYVILSNDLGYVDSKEILTRLDKFILELKENYISKKN